MQTASNEWQGQRRFFFLMTIATGVMLNPLNSSMISLALHQIQQDFHLSYATVSWLISSFYLSSAVAQPVMGRLGDQLGKKTIFLSGLILVLISSLMAPFASSFLFLIFARLVQSIGSSSIYPAGIGLIREHIQHRQATALAVISVFTSSAAALGPTIGGLLISWGNWPAIFLANLPVVAIGLLLGFFLFPSDQRSTSDKSQSFLRTFDLLGVLLFALSVALLLWFLLSIRQQIHLWAGALGLLFLLLFLWHERKIKERAFIDVRMFARLPRLTTVMLQYVLLNFFNYSLFFGLPSYFQDEMHFSVETSGLFMLFLSGFGTILALVAGRWVDRSGVRHPLLLSNCLMVVSGFLFVLWFVSAPLPGMLLILALVGISYGLGNVTLQAAMVQESPQDVIGTSSGLFQTARYMGSILSSVALGIVFSKQISPSEMHNLGWVLLIISLLSLLNGWSLYRKQ